MVTEYQQLLVVDDEYSICEIIGQYLQKQGYTVFHACDGAKAMEIIQKLKIDLVITDIKMPGVSGVELLKWIKDIDAHLPVLITTGFPTLDTAIEALKLGAFDYLTKPFRLEEIGQKVKRALNSKKLEEENLLFSKLVSLHEVTKALSSTLDIERLNHKFLHYSVKMVKADGGALMFHGKNSRLVVANTTEGNFNRVFWMTPPFMAIANWAVSREEAVIVGPNASCDGNEALRLPSSLSSYIAFPVRTSARKIGVLNMVRQYDREPFSNVDLEVLNVLASQASISIENVQLYNNIRDNYLKTIRAFALAVEAKDEYTHGHSENVMKYTILLAKHLDLSAQEIERIKYAGLLHDIGKIGVSESILNKAGRLTEAEFGEIKKHPQLGARILADVPFLKSLVPFVLHHHEFYNGKGYPTGIGGEEIPFGARILSVSDAYEAMTSDRPYRKSLSQGRAFTILNKERGQQFDPVIVDAFLEIMQVIEKKDEQ